MEEEIVVLQATGVTYFSSGDEDVFFGWLSKITCVKKIEGHLRTLYISINLADVDDEGLRELLALFMRYKIPLRQLKALDKDEFSTWFKDENKVWYKDVFGRVNKRQL